MIGTLVDPEVVGGPTFGDVVPHQEAQRGLSTDPLSLGGTDPLLCPGNPWT